MLSHPTVLTINFQWHKVKWEIFSHPNLTQGYWKEMFFFNDDRHDEGKLGMNYSSKESDSNQTVLMGIRWTEKEI